MTAIHIKHDRRSFLLGGVASAAALATGVTSAPARAGVASDLRMAVIGVRSRGKKHIREFAPNVVALCDVDQQVLETRCAEFRQTYDRRVEGSGDYRELLDRSDIDAVTIATPNHTHASIAIAAMLAGKDVYVEKPVSHNVWEGQQLVKVAAETGRVIQCGTQARSSRAIQEAVSWVRSGGLGPVRFALGTCYKPRKAIGKLDRPLPIPSHIDYQQWCGPAEAAPIYRPNLHYDWHWDYHTGAGDMGNQGIHQMDIARWFLGQDGLAPRTISIGGRVGYSDAGNTANTQLVYYDYPEAPLLFETRGLPRSKAAQAKWGESMDSYRGSQIGVIVQCEGGHLLIPNTYDEVVASDTTGRLIKRFVGGGNHFANFVEAVAASDPSAVRGSVHDGHVSSALCHLGSLSHLLGQNAGGGAIGRHAESTPLLAEGWTRLADHLRANEVGIDDETNLVLGKSIEIDPAAETTSPTVASQPLWKRVGRLGFPVVPA